MPGQLVRAGASRRRVHAETSAKPAPGRAVPSTAIATTVHAARSPADTRTDTRALLPYLQSAPRYVRLGLRRSGQTETPWHIRASETGAGYRPSTPTLRSRD